MKHSPICIIAIKNSLFLTNGFLHKHPLRMNTLLLDSLRDIPRQIRFDVIYIFMVETTLMPVGNYSVILFQFPS